jgi:hypothetical protein
MDFLLWALIFFFGPVSVVYGVAAIFRPDVFKF